MAQLLVVIPREGISQRFECWHAFPGVDEDSWIPTPNTVLVCPACQEIWAYMGWEGEGHYWPSAAYCRQHQPAEKDKPFTAPSGSILLYYGWGRGINTELLERMPRALLEREFKLHLASLGE